MVFAFLFTIIILVGMPALCSDNQSLSVVSESFIEKRKEMLNRKRRVILNNDGCDALYFPSNREITAENLLERRTTALAGTHAGSIFYCTISSGFGYFTHNTKIGSILDWDVPGFIGRDAVNAVGSLISQNTDSLQVMIDFCRANYMEIFWSMRMNDTHDVAHRPEKPYHLYSPIKQKNPEWLISTHENTPKHGRWSAVDYSRSEIREFAFRFIEEVCQNYDVDGIEMDFFRHLNYFKSVVNGEKASEEELEMMTDLVRRVRKMTEREGVRRGKPILVAVRVPDCIEYCRASGFDIERWLSEGLVDILIATCYFQLNPWEKLVELGHKYDVKVYPSLSESRIRGEVEPYKRNSHDGYRARAFRVWESGADGIYLFNSFNPRAQMLSEIGDPDILSTIDKVYFATLRTTRVRSLSSPGYWLADGNKYINIPILTPQDPIRLNIGESEKIEVVIGDDPDFISESGQKPKFVCSILVVGSENLMVSVNGIEIQERRRNNKD